MALASSLSTPPSSAVHCNFSGTWFSSKVTFKIISEGSQAFGIRRIVATSNKEQIISENLKQKEIKEKANSDNLNKLQKKEIELQNKIKIQSIKKDLTKNIRKINNVNFFVDNNVHFQRFQKIPVLALIWCI